MILKKYFFPYKRRLIFITCLSIICGLFEAVSLGVLVPLINMISSNQPQTGNLWNILQTFFGLFHIDLTFPILLIVLIAVFLVGQILIFFNQVLQINTRFKFEQDIKERIFSQLLHADLAYHNSNKIGSYIDTVLVETEKAGSGLYIITQLLSNIVLVIVYILMLVYISIDLTLICCIVVAFSLIFVNIMLKKSKVLGVKCVEVNSEINQYTFERFNLLKLIKANSSEQSESGLFTRIVDKYKQINTNFLVEGSKVDLFFQSIMFTVAVIIVYLSTTVFILSVGLLMVFLFTLTRLMGPLRNINTQRHILNGLIASLKNVDRCLTESKAATTILDGTKLFTKIHDTLQLKNVTYSYIPGKDVLQNVNLSINKKEFVAFVGSSGAGKSTLVDLILRSIDPTEGTIEVDGINLKEFNLKSYHDKVGLVSQDIYIFHEDVLFNICYGSEEISLERAKSAAKIAYAHEFIEELPEGYHTPLGDRGVKLSGGQKQRIALARAIYKNPEILVLDEATSALDTESEKIIQSSINAIKHKYTIIVVAHRLSTIENADKIVIIDGGKIVEEGNHDNLLKMDGMYAKYYSLQHGDRK